MPLTFPSHAALPLPLKLWRPRWFDGVALTVGAAAPDLAYPLDGSGLNLYQLAHRPPGLLLFCLPVTLLCCLLVRLGAPAIAAHLPGVLGLRDYGALGTARPAAAVTVVSALLGAGSHQAWDRATDGLPLADVASSVLGAAGFMALIVHIGRRRLILAWHGPAPVVPARPLPFWGATVAVLAAGSLIAARLPGAFLWHTTITRLLVVAAVALLCGAAAVRRRTSRP